MMSTDSSDVDASTSQPSLLPSSSPPPPPPRSPPFADRVIRPFTSQGSTFSGSLQPLGYNLSPRRVSNDRPSAERDSSADPSSGKYGPYMSASARTSYTRVDVDSLPTPEYPPLPPVPTAFAARDPTAVVDPTPLPGGTIVTTTTPITPAPDPPTNTAQTPIAEPLVPQIPQVSLTFLLVSGSRKTQSFDPEATVGRVKELVWNAWPARDADWQDERPPAPSYFRILYLGKILQDDDTLLRVGFPASLTPNTSPTIVHLSIRPYAPPSEDPALSKKKRLSVAITRRLSSVGVIGVGVGGGPGDVEEEAEREREARRTGCCTGCTIC